MMWGMDESTSTFTIGDLARELGVTTRTIRYYEERNLIAPSRTEGGQRVYGRRERGRLKLILRAKIAGFDLSEIKEVLDIYDALPGDQAEKVQAAKLIEMSGRRIAELDAKIAELTQLRDMLTDHLAVLQKMADGQETANS